MDISARLTATQLRQVVEILVRYARIDSVLSRQMLLENAGLSDVAKVISFEGPTQQFAYSLVRALEQRGAMPTQTYPALVQLLRYLRDELVSGHATEVAFLDFLLDSLNNRVPLEIQQIEEFLHPIFEPLTTQGREIFVARFQLPTTQTSLLKFDTPLDRFVRDLATLIKAHPQATTLVQEVTAQVVEPVRVLWVAENQQTHEPSDVSGKVISNVLKDMREYEFHSLFVKDSKEIAENLLKYRPHILHLAGSGRGHTAEVASGVVGNNSQADISNSAQTTTTNYAFYQILTSILTISTIQEVLQLVIADIPLEQDIIEEIVRAGYPILSPRSWLADKIIASFHEAFYRALNQNAVIEDAFQLANRQLRFTSDDPEASYSLYQASIENDSIIRTSQSTPVALERRTALFPTPQEALSDYLSRITHQTTSAGEREQELINTSLGERQLLVTGSLPQTNRFLHHLATQYARLLLEDSTHTPSEETPLPLIISLEGYQGEATFFELGKLSAPTLTYYSEYDKLFSAELTDAVVYLITGYQTILEHQRKVLLAELERFFYIGSAPPTRFAMGTEAPIAFGSKVSEIAVGRHFEEGYAVLIGVMTTPRNPQISPLQGPANDVHLLYERLTDSKGGGYLPENVTVLLNEQATRRNIQETLQGLESRLSSTSTLLLHFSGHSRNLEDDTWLIPYDTGENFENAISWQELSQWLARLSGHQLVLLDTHFFQPITPLQGQAVVLAAEIGALAYERPLLANGERVGIASWAFGNAIQGTAASGDGFIRVYDLYEALYMEVVKVQDRQRPLLYNYTDDDFPISLYRGGEQINAQDNEFDLFFSCVGPVKELETR